MHSCVYQGFVRHRRFQPITRRFAYKLTYLYLDLAELPRLIHDLPLLSDRRWAWASCYRPDHLGPKQQSLDQAVRACVARVTGQWPVGSVRLLTQWRCLGYYFSPLNLYFVYSPGETAEIEAIVAEVNNTPWREQHCYVLWSGNRTNSRQLAYEHDKQFHVSPFMQLDLQYRWRIKAPGDQLTVYLATLNRSERLFDAMLSLRRRDLNVARWLATTVRHPLVPVRILAGIYYEAFQLWMRKCPFYPHPGSSLQRDNPGRRD